MQTTILVLCVLVTVTHFRSCNGHGYLMDPPARSTMWREGFNVPTNYNDNQLNCGGYYNQWGLNRGKCGICGDPYQQTQPRDNESGGRYGKGIVSRSYTEGQVVTMKVMITANHLGWFEFKLCPNGSKTTPVTQDCLDKYVLPLADGSGTKYDLGGQTNVISVEVKLPDGVTCTQCVLQWRWHAGNNYGVDDATGATCKGCGAQEEFLGCADIAIGSRSGNNIPNTPAPTNRPVVTFAPVTNAPVTYPPFTYAPVTNAPVTYPPFTYAPVTNAPVTNAPVTYAPVTNAPVTNQPFPTFAPITFPTFAPITNAPATYQPVTNKPVTYQPITNKPYTNAPQTTKAPVYPTFMPITFPVFTNSPTTAAPQTMMPNPPVSTPSANQNSPLPTGFVPITPKPNIPYQTNPPPITFLPPAVTPRPQITTRQTQQPVTFFRPPTTQPAPVVTTRPTLPSITFFRPPTTARPQITTRRTLPPVTFFRPATTQPPPVITTRRTLPQITFFRPPTTARPKIVTSRPTNAPVTFTRPRTTPPPITTRRPTAPPTTNQPIIFNLGGATNGPASQKPVTPGPQTNPVYTTKTTPTTTAQPLVAGGRYCYGINSWTGDPQLNQWCNAQCNLLGGTCPPEFCECI